MFLHDSRYAWITVSPTLYDLILSCQSLERSQSTSSPGPEKVCKCDRAHFPLQRDSEWPFFILSVPFWDFLSIFPYWALKTLWLVSGYFFWKLKGQMCASFHVSGDKRRDRRAETEGKKDCFHRCQGISWVWSGAFFCALVGNLKVHSSWLFKCQVCDTIHSRFLNLCTSSVLSFELSCVL